MKNYQQTVINILIVVALAFIAWMIYTKPYNPGAAHAAPVSAPVNVKEEVGSIPIPLKELSYMAKPEPSVAKETYLITETEYCGTDAKNNPSWSQDCIGRDSVPPVWYVGVEKFNSSVHLTLSAMIWGSDEKLVTKIKVTDSSGNNCPVTDVPVKGLIVTEDTAGVTINNCAMNKVRYIDLFTEDGVIRIDYFEK